MRIHSFTFALSFCLGSSALSARQDEKGKQEPPPSEEKSQEPQQPKKAKPFTLESLLEQAYENLKERPEEEEVKVLERVRTLEERIREIEKRKDKKKDKKDLEQAKEELEGLRGSGWWDARGGKTGLNAGLRAEHRRHIDPSLPDTSDDGLVHFFWDADLVAILSQAARVNLAGRQTRTWVANHQFRRQQDQFDVRTARVDLRFYEYDIPFEVSAGRQQLQMGDERMVGDDGWINFGRAFDGVRLFRRNWLGDPLHSAYVDTRAFWGRPVTVPAGVSDDTQLNRSDPNTNFYAAEFSVNLEDDSTLVGYFLRDSDTGDVNQGEFEIDGRRINSLGVRLRRNLMPALEAKGEGVYQWGEFAGDDHRAWAAFAELRLHMDGVSYFERGIRVSYNFASGDRDPNDGDHGTFHPPYPSPHGLYGIADLVGWRNIREYAVRWEIPLGSHGDTTNDKVSKKDFDLNEVLSDTYVFVGYHKFFLAEERDAYYGPRGERVRRDTTGRASQDLGYEFDVGLNFGGVDLGYARFNAGEFFSDTGNSRDGNLFYLSVGYGF